jgi:serine/threonine-protein kinase HipA
MKSLNVFFEEKKIGTLFRDDNLIYSFKYSPEWIESKKSFPLSLAMPLRSEEFGNKITLSFFENLLPEGNARDVLEKGQDSEGPYELLKNFGSDCAGAIIISSDEKSPYSEESDNSKTKIKISEIFQAIEEKRSVAEVIANYDPGYLSIAGAQDKFVGIYENNEFYLPLNGLPTTHIIKVPIYRSGVKESVYNEYFCMKLAERVGLNVPECEVLDDKNHPLFIIKRYDRKLDKVVKRIHQQDFCQAQGYISEEKYEQKGGPSLKDNYKLIKTNVTIQHRAKALFDFLDWISFNLIIGNNDSHSKNISLLIKDNAIHLAPFYDLLCTAIYPKLKKNFSFKVGNRDDVDKIGKNQLEMLDAELGLRLGTTAQRVRDMSTKIMNEKDTLVELMKAEFPNAKIPQKISSFIENRYKSLLRQGL